MCCHPEHCVYEVLTSSPWVCPSIVASGSKWRSRWKQHHGSLVGLRCTDTGGVTRLVTHTLCCAQSKLREGSAHRERSFAALRMTGPVLIVKNHNRLWRR